MQRHQFFSAAASRLADRTASDGPLGLVLMRLNHLKQISHTYGFGVGDRVVETLLARLEAAAREQDLAGHLGGGCFALLLAPPCSSALVELAINRLSGIFDEPIRVQGTLLRCHCHGAGVLYPEHAGTMDALLAVAEKALDRARLLGHPYLPGEQDSILLPATDFRILEGVESGIDNGEFTLHYQPQTGLGNSRVVGVESLLRWDSPRLGRISPADFIPLVELSELIVPLTRWILNTALRDYHELARLNPGITVSVNLSAAMLTHPDLYDMVGDALAIWNTPRDRVVLEITETAMIDKPEASVAALNRLRGLGVLISIDDFGTGYSSLAYLERMPTDELKIDKSFVDNVLTNAHDQKIVHAVIDLAHTFDMLVVAEGIETGAQADLLRSYGCDTGQGYLFSQPLSLQGLREYMESPRTTRTRPVGKPAAGAPSTTEEDTPMSYTLAEFLAHAIAMEDEAAERYLELADMMEAHANTEVAGVFRDMNRFSKLHGDAIRERTGDLELPRLKSWQYRWASPPEVGDEDGFDYLMVPFHALEYARANEQRAMQYYAAVAAESDDAELRRLAGEFAAEEQEHTAALDRWLEQTPRP